MYVHPNETYPEPELWFHDIFRTDHSAYRETEVEYIRSMTAKNDIFKRH